LPDPLTLMRSVVPFRDAPRDSSHKITDLPEAKHKANPTASSARPRRQSKKGLRLPSRPRPLESGNGESESNGWRRFPPPAELDPHCAGKNNGTNDRRPWFSKWCSYSNRAQRLRQQRKGMDLSLGSFVVQQILESQSFLSAPE